MSDNHDELINMDHKKGGQNTKNAHNAGSSSNTSTSLNVWIPLMLAGALAIGMTFGFQLNRNPSQQTTANGSAKRVDEIIRYVQARYVDGKDTDELVDKAVKSILDELDPHSNYISPEQLAGINEELEGNFEGVGIQFIIKEDTIYVVDALEGGPSQKAGVRAGDKIIQIEDSLVAGIEITNDDVIRHLKGKKGSSVELSVKRPGSSKLLPFKIIRDKIPIYSVDASHMLKDDVGYVRISRFSATTAQEFVSACQNLEKAGMKHLVIDLRGNPGGYLNAATKILDQLFKREQLLVYTEGKNYKRTEYNSTNRSFFDIEAVAILIDEGSASASEIMAGAVQDADRGTIIGRRSFGKGLVQEQYRLSNGGALRLTVARYYTPSGRSIQKPYEEEGRDAYNDEMYSRIHSGELTSKDSIEIGDTTKYYTATGRIVYGGGGIMPDIFVPLATVQKNEIYLDAAPLAASFVYDYLDGAGRRDQFAAFENVQSFAKGFEVDDALMQTFRDFLQKSEVPISENEQAYKKCQPELRRLLKAQIARQFFDTNGFYYILNQEDEMILKAIEAVNDANY